MHKLLKKLESPEMAKFGFPIFAMSMGILCIWVCILAQIEKGSAADAEKLTEKNQVREVCIEYVVQFEGDVTDVVKEKLYEYFYNTMDADTLFYMTAQNKQIIFSTKEKQLWVEDGKYIHAPLNVSVEDLNAAFEELK